MPELAVHIVVYMENQPMEPPVLFQWNLCRFSSLSRSLRSWRLPPPLPPFLPSTLPPSLLPPVPPSLPLPLPPSVPPSALPSLPPSTMRRGMSSNIVACYHFVCGFCGRGAMPSPSCAKSGGRCTTPCNTRLVSWVPPNTHVRSPGYHRFGWGGW